MKITLTHPQPFAFTVHTAGVRVEVEGQGAPPDSPPPTTEPDWDTSANAALLEAFARLDPLGVPDFANVGPLGTPFTQFVVPGFAASNSSYRWTCGIVPPVSGEYAFTLKVKSGGSLKLDGETVWNIDRQEDATSRADFYEHTFTRQLQAGRVYPLVGTLVFQGNICLWSLDWKRPDREAAEPVATAFLHPPADWQSRLKAYVPPPPAPLPYIVPDASYQSPDLTLPAHQPIDTADVDPLSDKIIAGLGEIGLHPVFGPGVGIPFQVVDESTPKVPVTFLFAGESDPGPYPIPLRPVVEGGGGDGHLLVVRGVNLYELFAVSKQGETWHAGSGAIFDLATGQRISGVNTGWTSADAAGLPILPYLLRYDEFAAGQIDHAIRVSVPKTRRAFVAPATHWASTETAEHLPPMGCRLRLKASFDEATMPAELRPVVRAMKRHGLIVADNGGPFIGLCGTPDARWDNDLLAKLKAIKADQFEVLKMPPIVTEVK